MTRPYHHPPDLSFIALASEGNGDLAKIRMQDSLSQENDMLYSFYIRRIAMRLYIYSDKHTKDTPAGVSLLLTKN